MLSTLRSRLLLTYGLVIGVVLLVVGSALIFYLLRNPAIDRQIYLRIEQAADIIIRQGIISSSSQKRLPEIIQHLDQQQDIRVMVLSPHGDIIHDSRNDSESQLDPKARNTFQIRRGITIDNDNNSWLFIWRPLDDGGYLVIATPRIKRVALLFSQRLREVLKDDLLPPLLQGGLIALIASMILAIWMSHWVVTPLRRMVEVAEHLPIGEYQPVPDKGPQEVRKLAHAFNEMTIKVVASQQSQRDFLANVSHELKTPLTSIQGFTQAILDGTVYSPDSLEQAANVIHEEAGRMYRLVLDLLDLARLEAGTISMERSQIDLNAIVQRVIEKFIPQANLSEVNLSYIGNEDNLIFGDEDRLMQVFTNLIDNAIKNTPKNGMVDIEVYNDRNQGVVAVRDNGLGIEKSDLPRIFERFYQVDKSRAGIKGRGTGLGLPIVSEIVKAHNGSIKVESEPGKGSVFMVKIPLTSSGDSNICQHD